MILQHFPATQITKPSFTNVSNKNTYLNIDVYKERNKCIEELSNNCKFKVGDKVRASDQKDFNKDGYLEVLGICKNWMDYRNEHSHIKFETDVPWPKEVNPNPMILRLRTSNGSPIIATWNYVRPLNEEEIQSIGIST